MTDQQPLLRYTIHVRWSDLDAFNHVNNAVYSTYLEEARLAWLQSLDADWANASAAPVLANMQIDFRRPIRWPATVTVSLYAGRIGQSSLVLPFAIRDAEDTDLLYAEGQTTMVWIDPAGGRAVPLPEPIRHTAKHSTADRPESQAE